MFTLADNVQNQRFYKPKKWEPMQCNNKVTTITCQQIFNLNCHSIVKLISFCTSHSYSDNFIHTTILSTSIHKLKILYTKIENI